MMIYITYLLCFVGLTKVIRAQDNLGIIYGEEKNDSTNHGSFCMMFNPRFSELADHLINAEFHSIANLSTEYLCKNDTLADPGVANKVAFVRRGNCSFAEKALVVQSYGAVALVIISLNGLHEPVASEDDEYDKINISVSLMLEDDFATLMTFGEDVEVKLFSPPNPRIDWNMFVIWFLATGTVTAGAFWSGIAKHQKYLSRSRGRAKRRTSGSIEDDEQQEEDTDPDSFDLNPTTIIVFVVLMCGMLISLYFFYDYLVYVVITMFTLAACTSLYACVKPLWLMIPCFGDCRLPPNKLPVLRHRPEIRRVVLYMMCLAVSIWWAVERNKSYAWILQDILGVFFCIHMMKTVRLPSLMSCTILLSLLFVYDIFFVFVTPLFTKSGQSVMVDVATGGGSSSGEMLPMVLKVPRITQSALIVCQLPYSLLGFGDILVPGLLVSYCHGFDLKVGSGRIYFISTVIAYGVGLILTFIALAIMNEGQPALLYLVPCTLLTTFLIGACRREFRHLWDGKLDKKKTTKTKSGASSTEEQDGNVDEQVGQVDGVNDDSDASDSDQPLLINK